MGSFYSTCAISDLSITDNEEMVFQFIIPKRDNTYKTRSYVDDLENEEYLNAIFEKGLYCESSTGMYIPFGFPMFGTYSDYGDIYLDEESKNHPQIKLIENYFNLSIDDVMTCASRFDDYYEEIYEKKSLDGTGIKNKKYLTNLNFTQYHRKVYDNVLKKGYEDSLDEYYFWSDKTLESYINDIISKLDKINHFEKNKEDILSKMDNFERYEIITEHSPYKLCDNLYFGNAQQDKVFLFNLENGSDFKQEISDQYVFTRCLSSMYKYFRPSTYGSQTDNYNHLEIVANSVKEIIDKKKEIYEEY